MIRCMNLAYDLQSGFHRNVYVICNVSMNKISRIFMSFSETSKIICTLFFLRRKVKFEHRVQNHNKIIL